MKRMEQQKKEMITSYLERDVSLRQAARYAMYKAEEDFKAASREYSRINSELEDHLADLSDVMGYDPLVLPSQTFAQFDET